MLELNHATFPDNLAYYIDGNKQAAKSLKLTLNVNSDDDPEGAKIGFLTALQKLVDKATGYKVMFLELQKAEKQLQPIRTDKHIIQFEKMPFPRGGFKLSATIKLKQKETL